MMVVLSLEILWDRCTALWARILVLHVCPHALDAEAMAAWQDTGLNHEVEANTAVSLNLLGFILLICLYNLLDMALDNLHLFILHLLALWLTAFQYLSLLLLELLSLHFSILIRCKSLWLSIFIEENNFSLNPVSVVVAFGYPFLSALCNDDVSVLILNLILLEAIFNLFFNGFLELFPELSLSGFEKCQSFVLVELCLLAVKFSNKCSKVVKILTTLINDFAVLLLLWIFNLLIILVDVVD